jgi:hypothetical protein
LIPPEPARPAWPVPGASFMPPGVGRETPTWPATFGGPGGAPYKYRGSICWGGGRVPGQRVRAVPGRRCSVRDVRAGRRVAVRRAVDGVHDVLQIDLAGHPSVRVLPWVVPTRVGCRGWGGRERAHPGPAAAGARAVRVVPIAAARGRGRRPACSVLAVLILAVVVRTRAAAIAAARPRVHGDPLPERPRQRVFASARDASGLGNQARVPRSDEIGGDTRGITFMEAGMVSASRAKNRNDESPNAPRRRKCAHPRARARRVPTPRKCSPTSRCARRS